MGAPKERGGLRAGPGPGLRASGADSPRAASVSILRVQADRLPRDSAAQGGRYLSEQSPKPAVAIPH